MFFLYPFFIKIFGFENVGSILEISGLDAQVYIFWKIKNKKLAMPLAL